QTVVLLLHKKGWTSPWRSTRTNKTLVKKVLKLDFQFCQHIWRHTVRPLRNRGGTGLKLDNEFNISIRGHSRQIVWKHIRILTHNKNIFKFNFFYGIGTRVEALLLWQIEYGGSLIR